MSEDTVGARLEAMPPEAMDEASERPTPDPAQAGSATATEDPTTHGEETTGDPPGPTASPDAPGPSATDTAQGGTVPATDVEDDPDQALEPAQAPETGTPDSDAHDVDATPGITPEDAAPVEPGPEADAGSIAEPEAEEEPAIEVPDLPRDELQKKANLLRRERDRLNDEARAHAEERDTYNAQVRTLVNQANEHKKRRDELNEAVRRQKEVRDEANRVADDAHKVADTMRRERAPEGAAQLNVQKLKKEAKQLEYQQMTQVLTPQKERGLVERLQEIGRLLRQKESALKADPELKAALEKADDLKEKAEKAHSKVGELAEKAQGEHDSMIKLYKESDKLRKKADRLQERFVVAKMEADKIHKQYIGYVNRIHEIEDALAGTPGGGSATQKQIEAAAEDVYDRFKSGEKLSTEDLMMLQKAGLL